MCLVEGVEMYVARLMSSHGGYIVKRMPDTGSYHAPDCPSYEPPAEFSGLGQVLGSAITEDPTTGETTLKLDFPLIKMPGRSQMPPSGSDRDSVASDGIKLTLRGLLHFLWDEAELTRWHPGFAGGGEGDRACAIRVQGRREAPPGPGLLDRRRLYRRLGRRFESELALWGAADDIHMVMVATFSVAATCIPTIAELSLMPVTRHWLPVENAFEKQLIEQLVARGRSSSGDRARSQGRGRLGRD
jgi:hypothetical protein